MPTITKRDLVMTISDKMSSKGVTIRQQDVQAVLQIFIEEINESLSHGRNVALRKFGIFEVREMKAKVGRNPKFPEKSVEIPARAGVKFKPSNEMKAKVASTLELIRGRKS